MSTELCREGCIVYATTDVKLRSGSGLLSAEICHEGREEREADAPIGAGLRSGSGLLSAGVYYENHESIHLPTARCLQRIPNTKNPPEHPLRALRALRGSTLQRLPSTKNPPEHPLRVLRALRGSIPRRLTSTIQASTTKLRGSPLQNLCGNFLWSLCPSS